MSGILSTDLTDHYIIVHVLQCGIKMAQDDNFLQERLLKETKSYFHQLFLLQTGKIYCLMKEPKQLSQFFMIFLKQNMTDIFQLSKLKKNDTPTENHG